MNVDAPLLNPQIIRLKPLARQLPVWPTSFSRLYSALDPAWCRAAMKRTLVVRSASSQRPNGALCPPIHAGTPPTGAYWMRQPADGNHATFSAALHLTAPFSSQVDSGPIRSPQCPDAWPAASRFAPWCCRLIWEPQCLGATVWRRFRSARRAQGRETQPRLVPAFAGSKKQPRPKAGLLKEAGEGGNQGRRCKMARRSALSGSRKFWERVKVM